MLVDCGQGDVFLKNAAKLGIDMGGMENVLITHGHYDHGDGMRYLSGKNILLHRDAWLPRFAKDGEREGGNVGLDKGNRGKNNFWQLEGNVVINEKVYLLVNIARENDFEAKYFPARFEDGADDEVRDEVSVAVKTDRGLVVISGCAHSGICNTIEYAKAVTGEEKVYAIVGGFHLRQVDDVAGRTLEYFKKNKIQRIVMGHCNIDDVIELFKNELGGRVEVIAAGLCVDF